MFKIFSDIIKLCFQIFHPYKAYTHEPTRSLVSNSQQQMIEYN